MKKLPVFFASALLMSTAMVATTVVANDAMQSGAAESPQTPGFNVLDVNKDSVISESEALYHGLSEKKFTVWDTNGDDTITEAEYEKGVEEKNDVGETPEY